MLSKFANISFIRFHMNAFPVRPSASHLLVRIFTRRCFRCSYLCMDHNYSTLLTSKDIKIAGKKNESSNAIASNLTCGRSMNIIYVDDFPRVFPTFSMGFPCFFSHQTGLQHDGHLNEARWSRWSRWVRSHRLLGFRFLAPELAVAVISYESHGKCG